MKRLLYAVALLLIGGGTAILTISRWRDEAASHSITLLVDWSEIRDTAARTGMSDADLLKNIHQAGANALLISPSTIQDYIAQDFTFVTRAQAEAVLRQLQNRFVNGVALESVRHGFRLVNRLKPWDQLSSVEVGINPDFLDQVREAGLREVFRVNQDPWLSKDLLFGDLHAITSGRPSTGFVLNTDDIPGGPEALPPWRDLLQDGGHFQLLFEFHPTKSAVKLAFAAPAYTFRAHTIAPNELRELSPLKQHARWRRAIDERSCRFLLFHLAPNQSLGDFLTNLSDMRDDFLKQGWEIAWPERRSAWTVPSPIVYQLSSLLAFFVAALVPLAALRVSLKKPPVQAYVQIVVIALTGALVMAALAYNPFTRIEVVPFRGVKAAFAVAWLGSFLSLYSFDEMMNELFKNVRRIDVGVGIVVAAIVGYVLIRMGNASAGWKVGWEQGARDRLEALFVARPRFKEFAIGYPLLLLGFSLPFSAHDKPFWMEGRFWIGIGMIGPISMVNTFCHLHSPLYLGLLRSFNGFALGTGIGLFLVSAKKWLL